MILKDAQSPVQSSEPLPEQRRKSRTIHRFILVAIFLFLVWVVFDLYGPRTSTLKTFDANEVARLETAMWRSYYQKERVKLFSQMTELLRSQYNLPLIRSHAVGYQAARAAFVFKEGKNRADYEKALPYLVSFYHDIRNVSDIEFDVDKAAKLELEWWIVHREREQHAPGELDRALAELPAEVYRIPVERLLVHARLRAEAMTIRDREAEKGGVSEADWTRIEELLKSSWQSLKTAVNTDS